MRILLIGGPRFLGYHLIESALKRGHQLTLFNRGRTNPNLFPEVERIQGDRTVNLDGLKNHQWDAVIDTCGYQPRIVRMSLDALGGKIGHYTFISSISVYSDEETPNQAEDAPTGIMADPTVEEITGETYGPLKVLCEQAVAEAMPGRHLNIRPGLIVGPYDPSDRFTYWPARVARGGDILAPGKPTTVTQIIDARDLADWTILMIESGKTGVYNATGPRFPLSMADILYTCKRVSGSDAHFTWVDDEFLMEQRVGAFVEMPLWVPPSAAGLMSVNIDKALANGLVFRSLSQTCQDTLEWQAQRPPEYAWRGGLTPEREAQLLGLWKGRQENAA